MVRVSETRIHKNLQRDFTHIHCVYVSVAAAATFHSLHIFSLILRMGHIRSQVWSHVELNPYLNGLDIF